MPGLDADDSLRLIFDRIATGTHTEADLATLHCALRASGQGNVVRIGKYNIPIGEGQDIRIGDTIYQGTTAEAIQAVIQEALRAGPPGPSEDKLRQAEARYRERVVETYNRLGFSGFPEGDLMLTEVPLDKVFVRPSLTVEKVVRVREGERRVESEDGCESPPSDRWAEDSERPAHGSQGRLVGDEKTHPERERIEREQEKVTLAAALRHNVLVVGEPGAGKSTLLRWLAVTYALSQQQKAERLGSEAEDDRLPVYVELGRLPDAYLRGEGGQTPNWKELLPELVANQQAFEPDAALAVTRAIADGRCLVLCDGLDEVADRTARARIAGSLTEFGRLSAGNRVVIGSRPAGIADTEAALRPQFQRCQIERFTTDEVQRFFRLWYELDTSLAPHQREAKADALYDRVQKSPGVAKLAATPLLATILLLIWRNEGGLPARRVEIYERCCKILVENWEQHHQVGHSDVSERTRDWETHLRLLAPVAYTIHSLGQRTWATRKELLEVLARSLQQQKLCSDEQNARREADCFLAGLGLRSGLLQRLGPEEYGFPHLSFQEYLAARYIGDQEHPDYIDCFMKHLHEGWWRDVHLLTLGYLGSDEQRGKKASRLIAEIMNCTSRPSWLFIPSGNWLVRRIQPGRWLPDYQWPRRLSWLLGRELELAARGCAEMEKTTLDRQTAQRLDRLAHRLAREVLDDDARRAAMSDLMEVLARGSPTTAEELRRDLRDRDSGVQRAEATARDRWGQRMPEETAPPYDRNKDVHSRATKSLQSIGKLDDRQLAEMLRMLHRRLYDADMTGSSRRKALEDALQLVAGRPMPGQRWVSIREREKRRRMRLSVALAVTVVAVILVAAALWTMVQERLGANNLIESFATAAVGAVTLLGALAEILGYLREKGKR